MIVEFSVLDTEDFIIEHIFDSAENERLRVYVPAFVSYSYKNVN